MTQRYAPRYTVQLQGRPCDVRLSARARKALAQRTQPLYIQMELYFSCLLRLKVRFYTKPPPGENIALAEGVYVNFRPVMTAHCANDELDGEPPVTDFPLRSELPFMPHWLNLDYRQQQWQGEFGYAPRK